MRLEDSNNMADFITQLIALGTAHAYAGIGGLFMALFVTLLTDRARFMASWDSPWRTVIGTLFGAAGMVLDMFGKGSVTSAAILSVVATVLPTLIAEITAATQGKMAARAAQRGRSSLIAMVLATVGLFGLVAFLHGCAFLKKEVNSPTGKTIRDVAVVACQLFAQGQAPKMGISLDDAIKALCSTDDLLEPWIEAQGIAQKTGEQLAAKRLGDAGVSDAALDH